MSKLCCPNRSHILLSVFRVESGNWVCHIHHIISDKFFGESPRRLWLISKMNFRWLLRKEDKSWICLEPGWVILSRHILDFFITLFYQFFGLYNKKSQTSMKSSFDVRARKMQLIWSHFSCVIKANNFFLCENFKVINKRAKIKKWTN